MSLTHRHLQSVCLYLPVVLKLFPLVIGEFVAAFLPTHFLTVLVQFWRQLRGSCEGGYIQAADVLMSHNHCHSDPSRYILEFNLANDRRISYYLEYLQSRSVSFLTALFI